MRDETTHVRVLRADSGGAAITNAILYLPYADGVTTNGDVLVIDGITAEFSAVNGGSFYEVQVVPAGLATPLARLASEASGGLPLTIDYQPEGGLPVFGRLSTATADGMTTETYNGAAALPSATSGTLYGASVRLYLDGGLMGADSTFHLLVTYHFEPLSARRP